MESNKTKILKIHSPPQVDGVLTEYYGNCPLQVQILFRAMNPIE